MATVKISALPAASALDGTEVVPLNQGGTTKKALVSAIQTLFTPTGSGFPHITAGVQDAAARAVDVSSADVTGTLAAARFLALTGDVTNSAGAVATTIAANAVTNAKAAQMAAHTFKGNNTGSTANSLDLTATQLTAELNNVVGDSGAGGTKGLAPAPGAGDAAAGKFLKADGTYAVPAGTAPPTGTGFPHITSGSQDAAARAVNLATADVTGVIPTTINAQTGTSYTVVAGDQGKLVTLSNAAAIAVTLPQATGSFAAGWSTTLLNLGAGLVTITPTTSTINGAATIVLATGQSITVVSDGTNYQGTFGARVANTLRSATTLVDVAAATAPTNGQVLTATGGTAATWQTPAASGAIAGFILGMNPTWTSTTVLGASSGTVYIESLAATISGAPADITPASPGNNTWWHIYVFSSSGTPTLEASTTAPVAFATPAGFARSKSGDTSRRYLYSARTDGSAHFWRFQCDQHGLFRWSGIALEGSPFRVLSAGTATSSTTVDCSAVVPTTSQLIYLNVQNIPSTGAVQVFLGSDDYTVTTSVFSDSVQQATFNATALSRTELLTSIPCSSAQKIAYLNDAANGATYIEVRGWWLQR